MEDGSSRTRKKLALHRHMSYTAKIACVGSSPVRVPLMVSCSGSCLYLLAYHCVSLQPQVAKITADACNGSPHRYMHRCCKCMSQHCVQPDVSPAAGNHSVCLVVEKNATCGAARCMFPELPPPSFCTLSVANPRLA